MAFTVTLPNDLRTNRPLLDSCVDGDTASVTRLLKLLGHPTPELRHAYQDAIRQSNQVKLWRGLVSALADRSWEVVLDEPQRIHLHPDPEHQLRIDESILELFNEDKTPAEADPKMVALHDCARSNSIQQRYIANFLLICRGERRAVHILKEMFPHTTLEWQLRTVRVLARLDNPDGGPLLIDALSSGNRILHHAAHQALTALGTHASDAWITALEHPNSHIRWHAARGLGELGDIRALKILVSGLRDENAAVRWATAKLLARMGNRAVPAILYEISREPLDEPARQVAYHALHGMSGEALRIRLAPLIEALHGFGADLLAPMIAQKMLLDWEQSESNGERSA